MATTPVREGNEGLHMSKHRLNVIISEDDKKRIDQLKAAMETDSVTDVTKNAFRLLEFFVKKAQSGHHFLIQGPNDTQPTKIEIFGVTT